MKWFILIVFGLMVGCSHHDPVGDAKEVIKSHEEYAKRGDLNGVMTIVADDIVVVTSGIPPVQGKEAFRAFYAQTLSRGKLDFIHEYEGADATGDGVVLYGVVHGTTTPADSSAKEFANNFLIALKYRPDGTMALWRIFYAPAHGSL